MFLLTFTSLVAVMKKLTSDCLSVLRQSSFDVIKVAKMRLILLLLPLLLLLLLLIIIIIIIIIGFYGIKKIKNEVISFKKSQVISETTPAETAFFAVFTNIDDKECVILHRSTNPSLQMLVLFYSSFCFSVLLLLYNNLSLYTF